MQESFSRPSDKDVLSFLQSHDIFGQFSASLLKDLLPDIEWINLQEGENLFHMGDPGGFFCLVYTGRLRVTVVDKNGSEVMVATIEPGMPAGEIQFLSGGVRTATVDAIQNSLLMKFSKAVFDRLAEQGPAVLQKFAEIIRGRLRRYQLVAILPVFCGPLDVTMLNTIESAIEWVHLPRGKALFYQGDHGNDFFILISGRLSVCIKEKTGIERTVAEVRRGTIVGEMAMFTGAKRTASIFAVRDSDLVRFSRDAFERIIASHPGMMMHFIQFIIKRMQEISAVTQQRNKPLNIAVIPAGPNVPLSSFTNRFADALSNFGTTLHISSDRLDRIWGIEGMAQTAETAPNNIRLAAWLDEQEAKYMNIIFEADITPTPWTKRCLQHADRVITLGQAADSSNPGEIEAEWLLHDTAVGNVHRTLVLLHPDGRKIPSKTSAWLDKRRVDTHYHIRWNTDADMDRLARLFTGNAIGLVLGGGGARGFAHIGVIRALAEANIPIDMIGGTSMGSMIAAQYAMGLDWRSMIDQQKKAIALKPFREFTIPLIALIKSKRLDSVIRTMCGDTQIEDMWLNYFCVSSNLTTAEMVVHRYGPLGKSVRASGALPGITKPVLDKNNLLVDGALFNNVPADIMKELCGGRVIMVDVSPDEDLKVPDCYKEIPSEAEILWSRLSPFKKKIILPGILDIMMRTIMVGSANKEIYAKKAADFNFCPPVGGFGLLEFEAIDKIVEAGYLYAKERIKELKETGTAI